MFDSLLSFAAAMTLTMSVSVYTPGANGISGGWGAANGARLVDGHAACGPAFRFGTLFEVTGDDAAELAKLGIPTSVECVDRGRGVTNRHLDIALTTGTSGQDRLKRARDFGRRTATVIVRSPQPPASPVRDPRDH